jgi:beta-glucanase (GH16 family)
MDRTKKYIILLSGLLCVAFLLMGFSQMQLDNSHYQLVFEDNFNGKALDTKLWNIQERRPWECFRYMTDNRKLLVVGKGRLRLYCKRNNGIAPNDTAKYLTAGINTKDKFTFSYGKIEVRARIVGKRGTQPAIWTLNNNWADMRDTSYIRAEIDLMECVNHEMTVHQTVHNRAVDIDKLYKHDAYHTQQSVNVRNYNIYAAEILPDRVVMSINNKPTLTFHRDKRVRGQFPYNQLQYLIIDMQYGTTFAGGIAPNELPAYMDVDWVRVYKYTGK